MGRINQLTPTTIVTADSVIAVDAANGGVTNKLTINTLAGGLRVIGNYASQAQLAAKQDLLTFDDAPEEDSDNPVTSGGIYNAIGSAMSNVYTKAQTDAAISNSVDVVEYTRSDFVGVHANVTTFYAVRMGNIMVISFRMNAGIASGAKLFTFPNSLTPTNALFVSPIVASNGPLFTQGSVWLQAGNNYVEYYGSAATSGTLFTTLVCTIG